MSTLLVRVSGCFFALALAACSNDAVAPDAGSTPNPGDTPGDGTPVLPGQPDSAISDPITEQPGDESGEGGGDDWTPPEPPVGTKDAGDNSSTDSGSPPPPPPPPPTSFTDVSRCNDPGLQWRSGSRTTYESYPEPGSEECIEFSGCEYQGRFSACRGTKSEEWVAAHHIVAVFPDFGDLELHDVCLRQGDQLLVATVYDTCGDHDCDGCCTRNQGDSDQLIDLEKYTDERWDVRGRDVEWADLGPTQGLGCEDEERDNER